MAKPARTGPFYLAADTPRSLSIARKWCAMQRQEHPTWGREARGQSDEFTVDRRRSSSGTREYALQFERGCVMT